jgi:hypothetical protein
VACVLRLFGIAHLLVRLNHFVIAVWRAKEAESAVKHWEIIADNLSKAGWTWGRVRFVTRAE